MIRCANSDVEKYLAEVRAEADKRGIRDRLEKRLKYLEDYGCLETDPEHMRCTLFKDLSPLSFGLHMEVQKADGSYKDLWGGAMLFHGSHDGYGSGAAPTFAVTVEAVDEDWSIHT